MDLFINLIGSEYHTYLYNNEVSNIYSNITLFDSNLEYYESIDERNAWNEDICQIK